MVSALTNQKIIRRDFRPEKPVLERTIRSSGRKYLSPVEVRNQKTVNRKKMKGVLVPLFFALLLLLSAGGIFFRAVSRGPEVQMAAVPGGSGLEDFTLIYDDSAPAPEKEAPALKRLPASLVMEEGDSIYNIAQSLDISYYDLLVFNHIKDPRTLRKGERIFIPQGVSYFSPLQREEKGSLEKPRITGDRLKGTSPLTVNFSVTNFEQDEDLLYLWHLGEDRFAYSRDTSFTYKVPGTYRVFLLISRGGEQVSNILTVEVQAPAKKKPVVKTGTTVRKEKEQAFIVLDQVGAVLDTRNYVKSDRFAFPLEGTKITQNVSLLKQVGDNRFEALKAGYAQVSLEWGGNTLEFNLFVSPFPTKHSYDPPVDWYKTQFGTGFNGNCGPACVAMAVDWTEKMTMSVEKAREEIGYPIANGAISFYHMLTVFKEQKVKSFFTEVKNASDLRELVDRGNIAIILLHTGKISRYSGDTSGNYTGRYYADATGHYIIVKGYTLDKNYFVVYDPIPGDWGQNKIRYSDGLSMIGKNRYYKADELLDSLKTSQVVEISRD